MIWLFLAAATAAVVFGVRLLRLKRQLQAITTQLDERTGEKSGKIVTVSLIDRDIDRLAAAVNRSLNLQKKLRIGVRRNDLRLKDSIANLSHDLRTPLTSILGYLQLARESGCTAEKRKEYLKIADGKAHELKFMINSLYELSMLDVTEMPLKCEHFDLNLLLSDVLAGQYGIFQALGINLKISLPNQPMQIVGDRVACTRVIQNLLNNASRYAKENAEVVLESDGSYALLSVANSAPDLKEEDVGHLFERFYTADHSRSSGSSGLGLYIVKTLLEKMGGKVADVSLVNRVLHIQVGFQLDGPVSTASNAFMIGSDQFYGRY